MLKKYIAREPKVDVVLTSNKDCATIAAARVIYQDTDPEMGEVPDIIRSYHQKEGVRDVKLGEDLSEDQRRMLKDLIRRYPDVFTDMPITRHPSLWFRRKMVLTGCVLTLGS